MNTRLLPRALDPARRTFLKAGIGGTALLLLARWLPAAHAAAPDAAQAGRFLHLSPADAEALGRIVPVMLRGALPATGAEYRTAIDEILRGIDLTIDHQPPSVREEIRDLFGILTKGMTRVLVAGVWTSWNKASDDDVREFLTGWRTSRFATLRSAFIGLNNLVMGSWYGNPRSWARIGYGGPPQIARVRGQRR